MRFHILTLTFLSVFIISWPYKAWATPPSAKAFVVSVLPVWPGKPQGGTNIGKTTAPEGSGVVIKPGIIATAWHVIEPAKTIDVRLHDNRILPAKLIAHDPKSDIALLSVEEPLTPIEQGPSAKLSEPVCAIGNSYGLGISLTCGVVSNINVTNAGFNAVEDFVQTDAAINPGMSGGALVDKDGALVGMISAIFASNGDGNIGVNFAVSPALLFRVADELIAHGKVSYISPDWQLRPAGRDQLKRIAAPVISNILKGGRADKAGLKSGDIVLNIGERRIFSPRDAIIAFGLLPPETKSVVISIERDGQKQNIPLNFTEKKQQISKAEPDSTCPYPKTVCQVRQAVFPVRSFNPLASATRITEKLLVTNRHVVGDRFEATLFTPLGEIKAKVIPSAFTGDLVLLEAANLPANGYIARYEDTSLKSGANYYVVGADVSKRQVRVFKPGSLIEHPNEDAKLGQIHVTSYMQPGTSGGALIDDSGALKGISVGGGEGRFRALPLSQLQQLIELRDAPNANHIHKELSRAFVSCSNGLENNNLAKSDIGQLTQNCKKANIHGQLLGAGRQFARAGHFKEAIELHSQAVKQVPNSVNARISLLVSLQLGGRFKEMVPHAKWVMEKVPDEASTLRFAIQSGIWGDAPDMAEQAYQLMLKTNPQQAEAARRFIDSAPPAPPRR